MIIDGKALSEERIAALAAERQHFGPLTLAIVVSSDDPVTRSFIKIKKRIAERLAVDVIEYPALSAVGEADGVILQLPLPQGMDPDHERNMIPLGTDVDVLSDRAFDSFCRGEFPPPPVPRAMAHILRVHDIDPRGKKVTIVGQGRLVGRPAAVLFAQLGAHVRVAERGTVAAATEDADIIVLGAGVPSLLRPDMVHDGVIILDAGTSESGGVVVGDADPACAHKASLFTPVPRGIGPVAVAEIFANLFELKRRMA